MKDLWRVEMERRSRGDSDLIKYGSNKNGSDDFSGRLSRMGGWKEIMENKLLRMVTVVS